MSPPRRVGYALLSNIGASGILGVMSLGAGSLISYSLGSSARGALGLLGTVASLSATLGGLGLGEAMVRWIASGRLMRMPMVLMISAVVLVSSTALGFAVGMFLSLIPGMPTAMACGVFVACASGGGALWSIPGSVYLGRGQFVSWNTCRILAAFAWVSSIAIGIGSARNSGALSVILITIGVSFFVSTMALLAGTFVVIQRSGNPRANLERLRFPELLKFGIPTAMAIAMVVGSQAIPQLFAAARTSLEDLGQLVAASAYALMYAVALHALATITYQRVSSATGMMQARSLAQFSRVAVTLSLALLFPGVLLAVPGVRLLNGAGFNIAEILAMFLVVGALMDGVTLVLEQGMKARGRPRLYMWVESFRLVGLSATLLLFGRGIWSIAICMVCISALTLTIAIRLVKSESRTAARQFITPVDPRSLRAHL